LSQRSRHVYIIGGGEIYTLGLPYADKLDITRVHHSFEADTYFPDIDSKIWELSDSVFNSKTIIICMILPFKLSLENKNITGCFFFL
jgi:dihydrofolate reductase